MQDINCLGKLPPQLLSDKICFIQNFHTKLKKYNNKHNNSIIMTATLKKCNLFQTTNRIFGGVK